MPNPALRVLQSFPEPTNQTNPYLVQLVESMPEDVTVAHFSWSRALRADYDVFHVHWPETLLRARTRTRIFLRRAAFALLLLRLKQRRVAVVRTLHNLAPHEKPGRLDAFLLRSMDARTRGWIRLTDQTDTPARELVRTIPHGHYRDWYAGHLLPAPESGRLSYFGLIRPYKGVEELLSAFAGLSNPDVRLAVTGRPVTEESGETVRALAAVDARVECTLAYTDDATLSRTVGRSELVVLPYRYMHNSGALLLALSLGRPVLVPNGPVVAQLVKEVGPEWVLTYEGELTPAVLEGALQRASETLRTAEQPDLSARDWPRLGKEHADLYAVVVAAAHGKDEQR